MDRVIRMGEAAANDDQAMHVATSRDAPASVDRHTHDDLFLYLPGQWKDSMLLVDTILPWTSQGLLYYELWLITGHWMGSGHDHPADTGSLK
jgi:hypothetical protein